MTLLYFFIWIFIYFRQKDPIKVQIFWFSTARMKFNQIFLASFFKPQVIFPLNFASPFNVMTHNPSELCLAEILYALDKKSPSMFRFSDFLVLQRRFTANFSCHFSNQKFRVYSNFTSLFSIAMEITPLYLFSSNLIPHAKFESKATSQYFFKLFMTLQCHERNTSVSF